jgi:hypothetical protein
MHMRFPRVVATVVAALLVTHSLLGAELVAADAFDQRYRAYAELLRAHVVVARIDYAALKSDGAALDLVAGEFGRVTAVQLEGWSREEQIAFWINAYNVFTLQAIVDHYPIVWRWRNVLTLTPWNSIIMYYCAMMRWPRADGVIRRNGYSSASRMSLAVMVLANLAAREHY